MFLDCFSCPHEVIQYNKHLLNGQNQEMELFSGTKILPNLKGFSGTEGVQHCTHWDWHFSIPYLNYWQFCILNHCLLLSPYYFFPICNILYNSKWSKIFQACSQLALKNESKEAPPFWTFFSCKCDLVKCSCPVFCKIKKIILSIQLLISCNSHDENFWIFFHIFANQCTTRSYGYMYPKMFFFKNLVLVLEMAVLEHFWWKHSQGT